MFLTFDFRVHVYSFYKINDIEPIKLFQKMILTNRQKTTCPPISKVSENLSKWIFFSKDTLQFEGGILDSIEIGVLGVKIDENRIALTS